MGRQPGRLAAMLAAGPLRRRGLLVSHDGYSILGIFPDANTSDMGLVKIVKWTRGVYYIIIQDLNLPNFTETHLFTVRTNFARAIRRRKKFRTLT